MHIMINILSPNQLISRFKQLAVLHCPIQILWPALFYQQDPSSVMMIESKVESRKVKNDHIE